MRILLGAVLGLALGAIVVAALSVAIDQYAYLAVVVGGVLAGVLMRAVAGQGPGAYARGGLAALAAALAAVAGPLVATQWFQSQAKATSLEPKKVAVAAPAEEEESAEEGGEAAEAPVAEAVEVLAASNTRTPLRAPDRNPFAAADVVCLILGCLAAYQIAKGPEPVVASDEDGEPDDQPAPDRSVPPSD